MLRVCHWLTAGAVALGLTALAPDAEAVPVLQISSGADVGTPIVGSGNTVLGAFPPISVGDWTVTIAAGESFSNPTPGAPNVLRLTTLTASTSTPGTADLTLTLWETDITGKADRFIFALGGNNVAGDGTVTGEAYYQAGASATPVNPIGVLGPLIGTDFSATVYSASGLGLDGGYSVLTRITLANNGAGYSTTPIGFNSGVAVVPEPATLALFGFGLLGAAMFARRRELLPC
jgi:hypothetical protein